MKTIVRLIHLAVIVGAIVLTVGIFESRAFHKGVNARCNACHIMHASRDGVSRTPQPHLIAVEGDGCLACHASKQYGPNVYDGSPELSGGNYSYSAADSNKGHNPGNGSSLIPIDSILGQTPPGLETALSIWTCNSCHDTSGGFDFRLLRKDIGHHPINPINFVATNADESEIWDGSDNVEQSSSNHNVYRINEIGNENVGFGKWCAGCHPSFHGADKLDPNVGDGENWTRHPTAIPLYSGMIDIYGVDYDYLYPLETINSEATTVGAWPISEADQITCLTCHKAHASEYPDALRWDNTKSKMLSGEGCRKCHDPNILP